MEDIFDQDDDLDFIGFSPVRSQSSPTEEVQQAVISEDDISTANARAKQLHVYKPGIDFVSEAKLECLESRDNKWYKCKIVEVDWGELDILVHYNRWSKKFDEWLKMDSTRIRPITNLRRESKLSFDVGEKVLGFWVLDSQYYLGEVVKNTTNNPDFYEVRFYDGIVKSLRCSQIKKISKKDADFYQKSLNAAAKLSAAAVAAIRNVEEKNLTSSSMTPTIVSDNIAAVTTETIQQRQAALLKGYAYVPDTSRVNIFNVEIFEEKRKTKRKPEVEQLFSHTKKKRKIDDAFNDSDRSFSDMSIKPTTPIEKLAPSLKPLEMVSSTHVSIEEQHSPVAKKRKINHDPVPEMMEIDLGLNWKKVARRAYLKKKWHIYYVTSEGQKIRTRQQFLQCYQRLKCPIRPADIDFSTKMFTLEHETNCERLNTKMDANKKSCTSAQSYAEILTDVNVDKSKTYEESFSSTSSSSSSCSYSSSSSQDGTTSDEEGSGLGDRGRSSSDSDDSTDSDSMDDENDPGTNLSSVKLSQLLSHSTKVPLPIESPAKQTFEGFTTATESKNRLLPTSDKPPKPRWTSHDVVVTPTSPAPASLTEIKTENGHRCPKKGCEKSFRKEGLLQMHMKHYHPELMSRSKLSSPKMNDEGLIKTSSDLIYDSPGPLKVPAIETRSSKKYFPSSNDERKAKNYNVRKKSKEFFKDQVQPEDKLMKEPEELESMIFSKETDQIKDEKESDFKVMKKKESPFIEREGVTTRQSRRSETLSEFDEEATESIAENQSEDTPNAIINCGCKSTEEDGLMLQCDICLCWQHGGCYNIESEDQVPDSYICFLCENPKGERSSMKFRHHQDWLKQGRLPRLSLSVEQRNVKLENFIKRGHELSANVLQLSPLIHSLRLKLNIAKDEDHPKFVMWHKEWLEPEDIEIEQDLQDSSQVMSSALIRSSSNQTLSNILNETVSPNNRLPDQATAPLNNTLPGTSTFLPPFIQSEGKITLEGVSPVPHSITTPSFDLVTSDKALLEATSVDAVDEHKSPVISEPLVEDLDVKQLLDKTDVKNVINDDSILDLENLLGPATKNSKEPLVETIPQLEENTEKGTAESDLSDEKDTVAAHTDDGNGSLKEDLQQEPVEAMDETMIKDKKVDQITSIYQDDSISTVEANISESNSEIVTAEMESIDGDRHVNLRNISQKRPVEEQMLENDSDEYNKNCFKKSLEESESICNPMDSSEKNYLNESLKERDQKESLEETNQKESSTEIISKESSEMKKVSLEDNNLADTSKDRKSKCASGESESSSVTLEDEDRTTLGVQDSLLDEKESKNLDLLDSDSQAVPAEGSGENYTIDSMGQNVLETKIDLKVFDNKAEAMEVGTDIDIEFGGLAAGAVINDGTVLNDLLAQSAFDQLVGQDGSDFASFEHPTQAPIIPETERIEPAKCKGNLLKHIEQVQNKVFDQFDYLEKQLHVLEAEMGLTSEISKEEEELLNNDLYFDRDPATIQSRSLIKLLFNNFDTVLKMADHGATITPLKDVV